VAREITNLMLMTDLEFRIRIRTSRKVVRSVRGRLEDIVKLRVSKAFRKVTLLHQQRSMEERV
jgi:hypothetical protein